MCSSVLSSDWFSSYLEFRIERKRVIRVGVRIVWTTVLGDVDVIARTAIEKAVFLSSGDARRIAIAVSSPRRWRRIVDARAVISSVDGRIAQRIVRGTGEIIPIRHVVPIH